MNETTEAVREVLREQARLPVDPATLDDDTDLFLSGMRSQASVNVMLALEDRFDIEFPDRMLTRDVFRSIAAIADSVGQLTVAR
jgi:acyl carrier protein